MAWIMIPASALFLSAYGPNWLPVTYIGAAMAGAAASTVLARALRRLPIAAVAGRVLVGLALTLLVSWAVISVWGADWVCFGLLVLVPIVVPVGFVFLVGQAGLLLDVRSLKSLYARVVAGFALGFVTGGLAGAPLLNVLGGTENLLAAGALAAAGFFGLVVRTRRRYPAELAVVEADEIEDARPTLRSLAQNRFLALLVAFQMLSAVESQWLDFLVFDRAAERYHDSAALARFVSTFSAIAYGADIVFLLVCAGWLLRKFGLRYGLAANAVGVLTVVVAVLVAGAAQGSFATIVFVLVVAARVTDLTLSDGAARTSMSAAYQAVPSRLRSVTQAAVEGMAVPMAIGASGAVLLVVQALGAIDGAVLPVLTAVVLVIWVVVAVLAYREYRVSLLANLRGRTLDHPTSRSKARVAWSRSTVSWAARTSATSDSASTSWPERATSSWRPGSRPCSTTNGSRCVPMPSIAWCRWIRIVRPRRRASPGRIRRRRCEPRVCGRSARSTNLPTWPRSRPRSTTRSRSCGSRPCTQ